ncbi:unannotated protein [freshwater metagenome]|uniref:Unannotated protein n=1 Tax=freshwater metagenome TaxID=449393 RepID=A0A6J7KXI0_9ZZZZ
MAQSGDGRVEPVGGEPRVDLVQVGRGIGDGPMGVSVEFGIAYVEGHDGSPHLLGVRGAHPPLERGESNDLVAVHSPAAVMAACREAMKAREVKLAPDTLAIEADCAATASWHRAGMAAADSSTDRGSVEG